MIVWIFLAAVILFLALDLGVLTKHLTLSVLKKGKMDCNIRFMFSGVIYWLYGTNYIANPDLLKPSTASIKFITG
jgi:tellurite resistance protein TerC